MLDEQQGLSSECLKLQVESLKEGLQIWEFPKIRGTLFWGPYNKDPGTILGSPIFGNPIMVYGFADEGRDKGMKVAKVLKA